MTARIREAWMIDAILILALVALLPAMLLSPFAGSIVWIWIAVMVPHRLEGGVLFNFRINAVIAVVTLASFLFWYLRQSSKLTFNSVVWSILLFSAYSTMTTYAALDASSWKYWGDAMKTFTLPLLIALVPGNAVRMQSFVWTLVIALSYYAVQSGVQTLVHGGVPTNLTLATRMDNNGLAMLLVMLLPLVMYLVRTSRRRFVRVALWGVFLMNLLALIGTQSRGGIIGACVVISLLGLFSRRRWIFMAIASIGLVLVFTALPEQWISRMKTIQTASEESSFRGRVRAWGVAMNIAADRPLLGGGFGSIGIDWIYNNYADSLASLSDNPNRGAKGINNTQRRGIAAHNILMQVLSDHGWIGLFLYTAIFVVGFRTAVYVKRQAKIKSMYWADWMASYIQISLVGFFISGSALSVAYNDVPFLLLGIVAGLATIVSREEGSTLGIGRGRPSMPFQLTQRATRM